MSALYRREWKTLRSFEKRVAADAVTNVLCTPLEDDIFRKELPGLPSMVIRNGVAIDHYTPDPACAEPGHLVLHRRHGLLP